LDLRVGAGKRRSEVRGGDGGHGESESDHMPGHLVYLQEGTAFNLRRNGDGPVTATRCPQLYMAGAAQNVYTGLPCASGGPSTSRS
jgi:hypothetical protein